jgi:non-homologous end joining protein Ku
MVEVIANSPSPSTPRKYEDEYRNNLMRITGKAQRGDHRGRAEERSDLIVDLMARLQESLAGRRRPASEKTKRGESPRAGHTLQTANAHR